MFHDEHLRLLSPLLRVTVKHGHNFFILPVNMDFKQAALNTNVKVN